MTEIITETHENNGEEMDMMDWNHFLVYAEMSEGTVTFWHIIGLMDIPTREQREQFMLEVITDPEFSIPDEVKPNLRDAILTKEEFEPLWKDMNGEGDEYAEKLKEECAGSA